MISNILAFLKDLFYLKYLPKLGNGTGFGLIFLFGLLTSIHCIGMCGGIILTQCVKSDAENEKPGKISLKPAIFYNAGRIISYTIIGGVVGGIGQVLTLSGILKGIIPILSGVFMIIMAVNLLGIFPILRYLNISMPKFIVKRIRGGYKNNSTLIIGILTALMPCGPLQMIQLYALSTRSVIYGAASAFVFTLGTIPGLFTFGAFSTIISKKFSKYILKFSAVVVAVLGFIMIGRGVALTGITIPVFSQIQNRADNYVVSNINGNVQTVTTSIGQDYFPPIEVTQGVKVIWTIKVSKDVYCDCNNAIEIPTYNIEKKFAIGDNIVEFTPDKEGEFGYTCWMGMIKSKIKVVSGSTSSVKLPNGDTSKPSNNEKGTIKTAADGGEEKNNEIFIGWVSYKSNIENNPVNITKAILLEDTSNTSGLGIIPYIQGKALNSYTSEGNLLFFDKNSIIAAKEFLNSLPKEWENNITVKIMGYKVNNIPVNADETHVPETDTANIDHCTSGIHITKIEAENISGISTNKLP